MFDGHALKKLDANLGRLSAPSGSGHVQGFSATTWRPAKRTAPKAREMCLRNSARFVLLGVSHALGARKRRLNTKLLHSLIRSKSVEGEAIPVMSLSLTGRAPF